MSLEKNRGNNNCIPISGIGYIVIPRDVNTAEYVQRCYRNHSVSISGGYDSTYMHGVKITEEALNKIKFPDNDDGLGSAVVWLRDSFTNRAVVIGTLKTAGESDMIQGSQQRIVQETAQSVVEMFLDALNCTINISAKGNENIPAVINIKASSGTDEGDVVNITSKDHIITDSRHIKVNLTEDFKLTINNGEEDIIHIVGNEEELHITDHFKNEAIFNEENVQILTEKFNVGTGKEQMVLGNTLVNLLSQLIDAILNMTVLTHVGPSGTPVNAAAFSEIKGKLEEALSKLSNTD
nr:MAG TPA: hypothetical protein [Caudoviricetes sp.]